TDTYAEALSYLPDMRQYNLGPEGYLEHVRRAKEAVDIPIIGSLNGFSRRGWVEYARKIEQAGADALELNIYFIPTDAELPGFQVEQTYLDLLGDIRRNLRIPVAVKLGPYFTALAEFAQGLDRTGADALVLFNRFYQPDFDLDRLEVSPTLHLSQPGEL